MIDAFSYEGPAAGPRVLLLGGVCGDEKSGVAALDQLIRLLGSHQVQLAAGQLIVIPRVNAEALARGRRYVDEDLSRIITPHDEPETHEQKLANALIPYLDAVDAVLDLRAISVATPPFAYLEEDSPEIRGWAEAAGCAYMLAGWPALYALTGDVTPVTYALQAGKRGMTVVAGQVTDPRAGEAGLQVVLQALGHAGLLPAPPAAVRRPRYLRLSHLVRREQTGFLVSNWKNFEYVRAGTVIARYEDGGAVTCDHNGYVVMPRANAAQGEPWFYLATALDAPGLQQA